jgi:hypothetical protein
MTLSVSVASPNTGARSHILLPRGREPWEGSCVRSGTMRLRNRRRRGHKCLFISGDGSGICMATSLSFIMCDFKLLPCATNSACMPSYSMIGLTLMVLPFYKPEGDCGRAVRSRWGTIARPVVPTKSLTIGLLLWVVLLSSSSRVGIAWCGVGV